MRVAQRLQSVWDDRLGRELGGTFCLVFFPAAFLLDLMDLPGIKARGEDVGLLASVPHGPSLDLSATGPAVSMPALAQAPEPTLCCWESTASHRTVSLQS